MGDMQFVAEYIQWMYALCLLRVVKFSTVIGLDNIRCITEMEELTPIILQRYIVDLSQKGNTKT